MLIVPFVSYFMAITARSGWVTMCIVFCCWLLSMCCHLKRIYSRKIKAEKGSPCNVQHRHILKTIITFSLNCHALLLLQATVFVSFVKHIVYLHNKTSIAKFFVPDWGDMVDSGIWMSFRPAMLLRLRRAGTTTLWRGRLYPPVRN
jgi:hypothetical protein